MQRLIPRLSELSDDQLKEHAFDLGIPAEMMKGSLVCECGFKAPTRAYLSHHKAAQHDDDSGFIQIHRRATHE